MMLAFQFKLTPAQVQMLLSFAYEGYEGELCVPIAFGKSGQTWSNTAESLIRRGLISHSNDRVPSWQITPHGRSVADLIVEEAMRIVTLAETEYSHPLKEQQ